MSEHQDRYYLPEHRTAYAEIARCGLDQWDDLFTDDRQGVDRFPNRAFLERVLGQLNPTTPEKIEVLEYGCGTGPAACFLAERGLRVTAVDVTPEAIELARARAAQSGLPVNFTVQDICAMANRPPDRLYDLNLDSYCLQSIVTDADRSRLFTAVGERIAPGGCYVVSTAVDDGQREYPSPLRFDATTGTAYRPAPECVRETDVVVLGNRRYVPYRRHRTVAALRAEFEHAGFVVTLAEPAGNFVCHRPAAR